MTKNGHGEKHKRELMFGENQRVIIPVLSLLSREPEAQVGREPRVCYVSA